jgi:hypothetical protein
LLLVQDLFSGWGTVRENSESSPAHYNPAVQQKNGPMLLLYSNKFLK